MPSVYGNQTYGVDDLAVYPLTAGDVVGTKVDAAGVRSLTWNVTSDSSPNEGDNKITARARSAKDLTGSFEMNGLTPALVMALLGGTATPVGTSPAEIITLDEAAAAPNVYFQVVGQAPGYDGPNSAYRVILKKVMIVSGPEEALTFEEWNHPVFNFEGTDIAGTIISRKFYETSVPIGAAP
jgi:hypothetical protein